MSRSGYTDDCDHLALWRGAVERAIKGRRGQQLLREMAAAMDALPERVLIHGQLQDHDGDRCALGTVAQLRGLDVSELDPEDYDAVAKAFGVAPALVREVTHINDELRLSEWCPLTRTWTSETPQERWARVRRWVAEQIGGYRWRRGVPEAPCAHCAARCHDRNDYCHGCNRWVCQRCTEAHDHWGKGAHGGALAVAALNTIYPGGCPRKGGVTP